MTAKTRIVEHLGETAVLLPRLVADGLAANDRAKLRMSALQAAVRHASDPTGLPADLSAEARAAGLDPAEIGRTIGEARAAGADSILAPGAAALQTSLIADVETMTRALEASGDEGATYRKRLAALAAPAAGDDRLRPSAVAAMTTAKPGDPDSLHRLVMDLHKALNRLAAACADEIVAGAHCYGLLPEDRPAVEAFMRGLAQTRHLKFNHPGLETTAARSAGRLVIQNDIGTTDAHVLVVTVEDNAVTVTYTDVHRARAKFFVGLFDGRGATWTGLAQEHAEGLGEEGAFYLVTGRLAGRNAGERDAFLEAVGATLVFLIDWNKARKTLRAFVDNADAVRLLKWAARHRCGHRGFLQLGGADLVNGAVRRAAAARIGYGVRLDAALGREGAVDFLQAVLRLAAEGLAAERADRLIRDAIDADLARRFERSESELLQGVVRQAGLAHEIAGGLAAFAAERLAGRRGDAAAIARMAKRIEEKADRIAVDLRAAAERFRAGDRTRLLIDTLEDSIDDLEEAAFFLSLLPADRDAPALAPFATLCETAAAGAEAVARAADAAAAVPGGHRADFDDALEAAAELTDLEHKADGNERETIAAVLTEMDGHAGALPLLECARKVERATDRFARAGHALRAHVIGDLTN
ncbi:MAG TPA: hypothetical protein VMQ73_15525 [Methylomirabilota bacterium]|nr:hypothetical protein [Methylomirabilota bacterium]